MMHFLSEIKFTGASSSTSEAMSWGPLVGSDARVSLRNWLSTVKQAILQTVLRIADLLRLNHEQGTPSWGFNLWRIAEHSPTFKTPSSKISQIKKINTGSENTQTGVSNGNGDPGLNIYKRRRAMNCLEHKRRRAMNCLEHNG
jgi:hypothetical protein